MQLRQATQNDFNFIASSYLKSYRFGPETKHLINDIYYDVYKDKLNQMLETGSVTIACSDEDPDQILGYLISGQVHGRSILHYVYVKHLFRHLGVAKTLLQATIPGWGVRMTLCTHTARRFADLRDKYKLVYSPDQIKGA